MILDSLDQSCRYHSLHHGLAAAFDWLHSHGATAALGKHEVTDGVLAIMDAYRTAPAAAKKWESHRRHLDLQAVISGSESVGWAPIRELTTRTPYQSEKDAEFYEPPVVPVPRFRLRPGLFAIFFPEDGHQPGVMEEVPGEVRKIVFKLRI